MFDESKLHSCLTYEATSETLPAQTWEKQKVHSLKSKNPRVKGLAP